MWKICLWTSLGVQWLRPLPSIAEGEGSIFGWGTKIPHATQSSQKEKKNLLPVYPYHRFVCCNFIFSCKEFEGVNEKEARPSLELGDSEPPRPLRKTQCLAEERLFPSAPAEKHLRSLHNELIAPAHPTRRPARRGAQRLPLPHSTVLLSSLVHTWTFLILSFSVTAVMSYAPETASSIQQYLMST